MERLDKAYEAIDLLKSIDMPISLEQMSIIERLEKDYLREEVIPLLEEELLSLVDKMKNSFELEISYSHKNGLDITMIDRPIVQTQLFEDDYTPKKQKKYLIRVIFPDNSVSCKKIVGETLMDVVRYAGPENVQRLGIHSMGLNLVSNQLHENERYRIGQKEIEPGLYLCTYSSTEAKYEIIKKINQRLNLGLRIEKQML